MTTHLLVECHIVFVIVVLMLEVDITDLFNAIVHNDSSSIVHWICQIRDADCRGSNVKVRKISNACQVTIQCLIRLFCAKYLTRSLVLIETFKHLITACVDTSIDSYVRWQRITNVCGFLACNTAKHRTIHVFPNLISPVMELDEHDQNQRQNKIAGVSKRFESYSNQLAKYFEADLEHTGTTSVKEWLDSDALNTPTYYEKFIVLEHVLMQKRVKEAHRLTTAMIIHGNDVRTSQQTDIVSCIWNIVTLVLDTFIESGRVEPCVKDYIQAAQSVYCTLLPTKRNAKLCRLSLLYYAMIVLCNGKCRHEQNPPTSMTINLPTTFPKELSYLCVFPNVSTIRGT